MAHPEQSSRVVYLNVAGRERGEKRGGGGMSAIVSAVAFEDEVLVPPNGYVALEDKTIPVTEQVKI